MLCRTEGEGMTKFGASDWMKKKGTVVIAYTRISDNQQSKDDKKTSDAKKKPALREQRKLIDDALKAGGLPAVKDSNWFSEVQSGTNRDRAEWGNVMARARELTHQGKRVFIAVKDPSRWARNTRHSMVAIDRLHEMGIPVYAVREGIQTGSVGDLHPTEELLFVQLQGGASFVSQEQKKKADASVSQSKEAGVMASKGQSLFPFARIDPLEAYIQQLPLLTLKAKEGGGKTAFKETVAAMSQPNGITASGVTRMMEREERLLKVLSRAEYEEWRRYRTMVRDMLIEFGHDPFANNTDAGKIDFRAVALMRMVGRYLQEPDKYIQRTDDEIQDIVKNFKQFLGTKALKRYAAIVGKR